MYDSWKARINATLVLTIVAVGALTLVGCAGGDVPVAEDSTPTAPATVKAAEAKEAKETKAAENPNPLAYVNALATNDVDQMKAALKLAAKGSTAAVYLEHQANLLEAELDGGGVGFIEADDVTRKDASIEWCSLAGDDCVTFSDFKVDKVGTLTDFKLGGQSIADQLTVGNGAVHQSKGVKVQFLTAYKNKVGLWVIAKMTTSDKPVAINNWSATYRAPDGKQREATEGLGPTELDAKSSTTVGMVFAGAKPGGNVTLDGSYNDFMQDWQVTFTVG